MTTFYFAERGFRDGNDLEPWCVSVRRDLLPARQLDPRLDLENKSPTGFSWGYGGSGPAQLALALLADALGDDQARRLFQRFKWDVVAAWPQSRGWQITDEEIRAWANEARRKTG